MSNTSALAHFANTVLVPCKVDGVTTLQTLEVVHSPRKKRPHCKSRKGCVACKRRRVKCDECFPCSNCVKRNIQCLQTSRQTLIAPNLCTPSIRSELDMNPQISLLHLELFHHWDRETRLTLTFPQVWPVVTQRAFDVQEDFVMSAILCVAAKHLATLCPQNTKYTHESAQLMVKAVKLFRKNLSRPFTKGNCEALMGTALLMNYISWFDLGFLDDVRSATSSVRLDLVQDQLFFLSPGIVQVWLQAMPIFIDEKSVFTQIIHQNPRLSIEEALAKRGEDPGRFVASFMRIWDNPRYQTLSSCTAETDSCGPTSYSWRLLLGLEMELSRCRSLPCSVTSASERREEDKKLVHLRDTVEKLTTKYKSINHQDTSVTLSSQSARSSFENIVRRISPLLCCTSLKSASNMSVHSGIMPSEADIEQLFYGFPILCCGPVAKLMMTGDSRALVFLFHFYRGARVLLAPERCWWACGRSRVMENLILQEMESRGLDVCLDV